MKLNHHTIFLLTFFYFGWFGCVFFATQGWNEAAFIFPVLEGVILRWAIRFSFRKIPMLTLLVGVGIIFDTVMAKLQFIIFPLTPFSLMPSWLMAMWLLFVPIIPLTGKFLENKLIWAAFLGAVFGPLSYISGASFGVLAFTQPLGVVAYVIFWGLYFPAALYLQRKYI